MELMVSNGGFYRLNSRIQHPPVTLGATDTHVAVIGPRRSNVRLSSDTQVCRGLTLTPVASIPNSVNRPGSVGRTIELTEENTGSRVDLIFTGTIIDLPGVIGSGISKPGYGYQTKESASSGDFRNGFYGVRLYYKRGGKIQFTLADVSEADIAAKWGLIAPEIALHPFIIITNRAPFEAAYVWADPVPVPTQGKPGYNSITWSLISN